MKLPAFNHAEQRWDGYKCFHVPSDYYGNKPIVHFATGEVGITSARPKPQARRTYEEYGFALTSTADGEFTFARPDGTVVPRAWLTADGGQYLLVDLDSKRAVRLTHSALRDANVPRYMQGMRGGFLREKGMPLGSDIVVRQPCIMTPERKQWAADLRGLAGAHCVMKELTHAAYWSIRPPLEASVFNMPVEQALTTYYLTDESLRHVWTHGVKFSREIEKVPYLLIK